MKRMACILLFAMTSICHAQTSPALDEVFNKIESLQKQIKDLTAQRALLVEEAKNKFEDYRKKMEQLTGTIDPIPVNPPKPKSELTKRLKDAYDTDDGKPYEKKKDLENLAELYNQGATKFCDDTDIKTVGELRDMLRAAISTLADDRLSNLRKEISKVLGTVWKSTDQELTPELRKETKQLFLSLSTSLMEIAK